MAILSTLLGIGASTAIFSVIHGVVLDPFPYKDVDTLMSVKVWEPGQRGFRTFYSVDQFLDIAEHASIFSGITVSTISDVAWTGRDEPQRLRGNYTTFDGLEIMGVPAVVGRIFTKSEGAPGAGEVAVLGYRFWQRQLGGDPKVLGSEMILNGKLRKVIGVMPPRFMWRGADVYLPLKFRRGEANEGVRFVHVLGRLKPAVTEAQAEANLRPVIEEMRGREPSQFPEKFRVGLLSFAETFPSGIRDTLWILLAAVGLLLLIACANVSNLLLSRALVRQREMAVRASLGASRGRMIRQLLTENLIVGLTGGALGVLAAWAGIKAILRVIPPFTIPDESEVALNLPVLGFSLGVSILTALIFGLAPAWQGSRADLAGFMKESSRGSGGSRRQSWLRGSLVVAEVALSVMLLVSAGVMIRSLMAIGTIDLGIHSEGVLSLRVPLSDRRYPDAAKRILFVEEVLKRVKDSPGVVHAAVNTGFHPFGNFGASVEVAGLTQADARPVTIHSISPGYLKVFGIALRRGRELDQSDIDAKRMNGLVSERFAQRYFPGRDAIGGLVRVPRMKTRPFSLASDAFQIVGIVADTTGGSLRNPTPELYVPHSVSGLADYLVVRIAAGEPMSALPHVRAAMREIAKDQPILEPFPVDAQVARLILASPRFNVILFGVFAGLGLLLALIGIYGVMSNSVARRTQEIGVRMALGATLGDVVRWVLWAGARLIAIGLAIGLSAAALASSVLKSIVWNISPLDPIAFASVAILLTAAGLLAAWIPAKRAAGIDPLSALRQE